MQAIHAKSAANIVYRLFVGIFAAAMLASCSTTIQDGVGSQPTASGETFDNIGEGSVKVALLLPLSAQGDVGATARALKQAAELALFEFNNPDIILTPKDTQGTAEGAAAVANQAVAEGAELIVGPLFAHSVAAVGPIARQANIPVIAFSTDSNVAGRGVYLLSFLPQDDIAQVVRYAASKGKRSYAAVVPQTAYGTLVESALTQAAANSRSQVAGVERFADAQGIQSAASSVAAAVSGGKADAIVVAEGDNAARVGAALVGAGVDTTRIKLLGSGQWDETGLGREKGLAGAWYAAPDPAGWRSFSSRYKSTYGAVPPRIATLAYDAVSLAAALAKQPAGQRFTQTVLTNPSGFSGIDGIFRFRANGLNDRGLAILETQSDGTARVINKAPKSFSANDT